MFIAGYAGHRDLNQVPAYGKAFFEPRTSALHIAFYDDVGVRLAEVPFPAAQLLECGPMQSRLSLDSRVSSAEAGRTSERLTITLKKIAEGTRIQTRVEAEHAWLLFRSAKQWEYWGDFEYHKPAN